MSPFFLLFLAREVVSHALVCADQIYGKKFFPASFFFFLPPCSLAVGFSHSHATFRPCVSINPGYTTDLLVENPSIPPLWFTTHEY
jgi:hypothetical protein